MSATANARSGVPAPEKHMISQADRRRTRQCRATLIENGKAREFIGLVCSAKLELVSNSRGYDNLLNCRRITTRPFGNSCLNWGSMNCYIDA